MNVWEWFFGQAVDAFTPSGKTALDEALQQIYKQPLPPLDSPLFKQVFALLWAVGIVLAIVSGTLSGTFYLGRSLTSIGGGIGAISRFTFFIRVIVFGLIAPPATAFALYIAHSFTEMSLKLPGVDGKPESISLLSILAVVSDALTNALVSFLNWGASLSLQAQSAGLTILVLIVVALSPVFYAFSIVGDGGLALWRFWIALWMMPIVATPLMAWILALGRWLCSWLKSQGGLWAASASWGALVVMGLAAAVPLILFILFQKKVKEHIRPAFVPTAYEGGGTSGGASSPVSRPSLIATGATAALGARIVAHNDTAQPIEATPRRAGGRRLATGALFHTAATAAKGSHPVAAVGLTVLGLGASSSGRRAYNKAQAGSPAPADQLSKLPPPPPGSTPVPPPVVSGPPPSKPQVNSSNGYHTSNGVPVASVFLPVPRRDQVKS